MTASLLPSSIRRAHSAFPTRTARRGFTLVEMLIVIALIIILLSLLIVGLNRATKSE